MNAADGAGAEIYAQKEYSEARSFIMNARQLQKDGNHKTAQEMAERAGAAARKAKEKAEEEKIRKRSSKSKKGW